MQQKDNSNLRNQPVSGEVIVPNKTVVQKKLI